MLNLAGNAVKFTERGAVTLTARADTDSQGRPCLCFEVEDTGIGIPDHAKPRLFSMFSQADSSTARRFGGSGLGLAISRRIVELMDGEIGFDSQWGKGSTFWFRIPARRPPGSAVIAPGPLPLEGRRFLVIDDTPMNLDIFRRQIEAAGGKAECCASAAEALAILGRAAEESNPFAALILDHQMPDISGIELAEQLRQNPGLGPLRLLLATSAPSAELRERAIRLGIDCVLCKPVRQTTLIVRLMELGRRRATAVSPQAAAPAVAPGQGPSLRILIAEDNAVNQQVAAGLLAKLGHRTDLANDGREAVHMVETGIYDLVLMDVQMPDMDGIAATRAIRALASPAKAAVPIIAMTANAMAGDRENYLAAGMDDYIAKPVDRRRLQDLLDRWSLRLAAAARVAGDTSPPPALQDPAVAAELTDDLGPELYRTLLQSFATSLPETLAAALDAAGRAEPKGTAMALHSIKGAAANLGFLRLSALAERQEARCKIGDAAGFDLAEISRCADATLALCVTASSQDRDGGIGDD